MTNIRYIQQNETKGADNNFFNISFCQRNFENFEKKKSKSFGFFSQNSSKVLVRIPSEFLKNLEFLEQRASAITASYLILPQCNMLEKYRENEAAHYFNFNPLC